MKTKDLSPTNSILEVHAEMITDLLHGLWQKDGLVDKFINKSSTLTEDYKAPIIKGFFENNNLSDLDTVIQTLETLIQNSPNGTVNLDSSDILSGLRHVEFPDTNDKRLTNIKAQQLLKLLKLKQNSIKSFGNLPDEVLEAIALQYDDFEVLNRSYGLAAIQTKDDSNNTAYIYCNALRNEKLEQDQKLTLINNLLAPLNNLYNNIKNAINQDENTISINAQSISETLTALIKATSDMLKDSPQDSTAHRLANMIHGTALYLNAFWKLPYWDSQQNSNSSNLDYKLQKFMFEVIYEGRHHTRIEHYFYSREGSLKEQQQENEKLIQLCEFYLAHLASVTSIPGLSAFRKSCLEDNIKNLKALKNQLDNQKSIIDEAQHLYNALGEKAWQTYLQSHTKDPVKVETTLLALVKNASTEEIKQLTEIAKNAKNLNHFINQAKKQPQNTLLQNFLKAPQLASKIAKLDNQIQPLADNIKNEGERLPLIPSALPTRDFRLTPSSLDRMLNKWETLSKEKNDLLDNPWEKPTHSTKFSLNPIRWLSKSIEWLKNKSRAAQFKKINLAITAENSDKDASSFSAILAKLGLTGLTKTSSKQSEAVQVDTLHQTAPTPNPVATQRLSSSRSEELDEYHNVETREEPTNLVSFRV